MVEKIKLSHPPLKDFRMGTSYAEVPSGGLLLGKTLAGVNKVMEEAIHEFHSQPTMSAEQIQFVDSPEDLMEKERQEKGPRVQFMYAGLLKTGVPPTELDALFSNLDQTSQLYLDRSGTVYLTKATRDNLSKDSKTRIHTATTLGFELIEQILERQPTPLSLSSLPWREIARNHMEIAYKAILEQSKQYPDFDREVFASFREAADKLLEHKKTRFAAKGARVYVIYPEKDIETSDFIFGSVFNSNIISIISKPIKERFMIFMAEQRTHDIPTDQEMTERTNRILKTLAQETGLTTDIKRAFLDSIIPPHYHLIAREVTFRGKTLITPWTYQD